MKKIILTMAIFMNAFSALAAEDICGLWTTIDDETGQTKSIVQVYEYNGKHYGRVVDLIKNKDAVAAKLAGAPKIIGLDVIWDLKDEGKRFAGGKIMDPVKGKVYGCEAWREGDKLIVRGKIAFLGRNQTWLKAADNAAEALINPKPVIRTP